MYRTPSFVHVCHGEQCQTEAGKLFIDANICHRQILSRDSVTVSVDAVVYFNVIDAEQALCSVDDFRSGRTKEAAAAVTPMRRESCAVVANPLRRSLPFGYTLLTERTNH